MSGSMASQPGPGPTAAPTPTPTIHVAAELKAECPVNQRTLLDRIRHRFHHRFWSDFYYGLKIVVFLVLVFLFVTRPDLRVRLVMGIAAVIGTTLLGVYAQDMEMEFDEWKRQRAQRELKKELGDLAIEPENPSYKATESEEWVTRLYTLERKYDITTTVVLYMMAERRILGRIDNLDFIEWVGLINKLYNKSSEETNEEGTADLSSGDVSRMADGPDSAG